MEKGSRSNGGSQQALNGSGREFWGRLPEPGGQNGGTASNHGSQPPSPTSSRKDRSSPSHSRKSSSSSSSKIAGSRTKGVPQSFGYVKKTNGVVVEQPQQAQIIIATGRTAHVSAVPRTSKLKVSGGTQTTTADFQASELRLCFGVENILN